jgi:hypothetical protein
VCAVRSSSSGKSVDKLRTRCAVQISDQQGYSRESHEHTRLAMLKARRAKSCEMPSQRATRSSIPHTQLSVRKQSKEASSRAYPRLFFDLLLEPLLSAGARRNAGLLRIISTVTERVT